MLTRKNKLPKTPFCATSVSKSSFLQDQFLRLPFSELCQFLGPPLFSACARAYDPPPPSARSVPKTPLFGVVPVHNTPLFWCAAALTPHQYILRVPPTHPRGGGGGGLCEIKHSLNTCLVYYQYHIDAGRGHLVAITIKWHTCNSKNGSDHCVRLEHPWAYTKDYIYSLCVYLAHGGFHGKMKQYQSPPRWQHDATGLGRGKTWMHFYEVSQLDEKQHWFNKGLIKKSKYVWLCVF